MVESSDESQVWQAFLWHHKRNEYLGTFVTAEEAAVAYDRRARVGDVPTHHGPHL
jgi:hypothetical protein